MEKKTDWTLNLMINLRSIRLSRTRLVSWPSLSGTRCRLTQIQFKSMIVSYIFWGGESVFVIRFPHPKIYFLKTGNFLEKVRSFSIFSGTSNSIHFHPIWPDFAQFDKKAQGLQPEKHLAYNWKTKHCPHSPWITDWKWTVLTQEKEILSFSINPQIRAFRKWIS